MPKVYATEPLMHQGEVVMPGESVDADANDTAAIVTSGRGTLDSSVATAAAKSYAAAAKAQNVPSGATV